MRGIRMIDKWTFQHSCGYVWAANANNVIDKLAGCPKCSRRERVTLEIANERIRGRKIAILEFGGNTQERSCFLCLDSHCGYVWEAVTSSVLHATGCPKCAGQVRPSIVELQKRLEGRQIEILQVSSEPVGKSSFKCLVRDCNGVWSSNLYQVLSGSGCRRCARKKQTLTVSEIQKRILGREIEIVSIGATVHETGTFHCKSTGCGHVWSVATNKVIRGSGCPKCAGKVMPDILTIRTLLADRNVLLKSVPKTLTSRGQFECGLESCMHGWSAMLSRVLYETGCPVCSLRLNAEKRLLSSDVLLSRLGDRPIKVISFGRAITDKGTFQCLNEGCGNVWRAQTASVVSGGTGCPKCSPGSDFDSVYIWRAAGNFFNGNPVYKIGITSARLKEKRIVQVANRSGMSPEIIVIAKVNCPAHEIEVVLKRLGDNPQYVGHDGATEFRSFNQQALDEALAIIESFAVAYTARPN